MNEKMTILEVSELLACTKQNVYHYINKGYLRSHKDERGVFMYRDDVVYFKKASERMNKIINAILSGGVK